MLGWWFSHLFPCIVILLSCHKDDDPHSSSTAKQLQSHTSELDSVTASRDGVIFNSSYVDSPFYEYYVVNQNTYAIKSSRSVDSIKGNYEFTAPDKLFFWVLDDVKHEDRYNNIQLLNDSRLVYSEVDKVSPTYENHITYY